MQKINIDKQSIVFFGLAAFLIAEVIVLVPWSFRKITVLSRRSADLARKIKSIEVDWPNRDKYSSDKEKIKSEIQGLRAKFIQPQEESKLLSFISASSKDFNVEIKSLLPGKPEDYITTNFGKFKYLPISVKAKGGFHNFSRFLDYLKESQYFFEIKKLSISSEQPYNSIEVILCGVVEEI